MEVNDKVKNVGDESELYKENIIRSGLQNIFGGSSIHGILQARILEWVAISFSRGSSQPSDRTWVSLIVGFTVWATGEVLSSHEEVIYDNVGQEAS